MNVHKFFPIGLHIKELALGCVKSGLQGEVTKPRRRDISQVKLFYDYAANPSVRDISYPRLLGDPLRVLQSIKDEGTKVCTP